MMSLGRRAEAGEQKDRATHFSPRPRAPALVLRPAAGRSVHWPIGGVMRKQAPTRPPTRQFLISFFSPEEENSPRCSVRLSDAMQVIRACVRVLSCVSVFSGVCVCVVSFPIDAS